MNLAEMWEGRAGKQAGSHDVDGEQLRDAGAGDLGQWDYRSGTGVVHHLPPRTMTSNA